MVASVPAGARAQDVPGQLEGVQQMNDRIHTFLERMQTRGLLPEAVLSNKPLSAYEANQYLRVVDERSDALDSVEAALLDQYLGRRAYPGANTAHGWWDKLYQNGRDIFGIDGDDWSLQFSPLLYLSAGKILGPGRAAGETPDNVWRNTRGARFAGHVGAHIYFEGRFTENQEQVVIPALQHGTAPRRPSTKLQDPNTYDWMDAVGVVGFRSRHFDVRFGRDTNRFGSGLGTVVLSNYAAPYDQLRVRADIGPIQYMALFAGFTGRRRPVDSVTPRKYGAFHRLTVRVGGRAEFSVFETIIFAADSLENRERFDLSYLNPIIFLRAAERDRGSPDNALLGASATYRPIDRIELYGELLLDEFKSDYFGEKWWANKWGWMVGAHLVDFPIRRLDLGAELARMRPFLYSHDEEIDAYVHFGDVLGHPAGPNAWDLTLRGAWTASRRLTAESIFSYTRRGRNPAGENLGADPSESYQTRTRDFEHSMLQGVRQNIIQLEGRLSFELLPSMWVDAALEVYSLDDAQLGRSRFAAPRLQLRWGLPYAWTRF